MTAAPMVGMIGLGLMGTALTERLLEHGFAVRIWNRSMEKAAPLCARGAVWSENPFVDCDCVIISLYSSDVVTEVLDQLGHGLHPGQLVIDTTTGDPEASIATAQRLATVGADYLEAPISGSSEQTRRGEATVLIGGTRDAYLRGADLWPILGKTAFYVGPSGTAAQMKLVSNLVLGLNRAVLAEGLAFAEALGIDPAAALEILKGSMAYSRAMDVKGQKMLDRDYSVQARLSQHLKDVRLMLAAGRAAGLALPLVDKHRELLEAAERRGLGELDNSAIRELWQQDGT